MAWPITPADVWNTLNYPGEPDSDADLYARAAVERIEAEVGPITGAASDSLLSGPLTTILLDHVYQSVTVTINDVLVPADQYTFDSAAGIIRGAFGLGVIKVTATAPISGSPTIEIAARELAAIWYRQTHSPRGARSGATATFVPLGYAIPREVSEKIAPWVAKKLPGIA